MWSVSVSSTWTLSLRHLNCTHHDCSTCNDYFVFVIHFVKNKSDISVTHVRSSLGFTQVCSWLSTCLRRAFDTLTQVESQVCSQVCTLQLAKIMECGLIGLTISLLLSVFCKLLFDRAYLAEFQLDLVVQQGLTDL